MSNVAIVLASGSGQRFEARNNSKHLTPVLEVPVIVWTLETIIKSNIFSSVAVVTRKKDLLKTKDTIEQYSLGDTSSLIYVVGSEERTNSFINGFQDLANKNLVDQNGVVALFDANRPLTPVSQLLSLFAATQKAGCACPARPVINGVARANSNKIIEVPDKTKFIEFVTPEFLNLKSINANDSSFLEGHNCLVEYALSEGLIPETVLATLLNSKLTYPEDKTFLDGLALDNSLTKPEKLT